MTYKRTQAELQRDLEGMKNPASWPRWPILPMKRDDETAYSPQLGILACQDTIGDPKPIIYFVNMLDIKKWSDIVNSPNKEYDSFEELQADGWVVD